MNRWCLVSVRSADGAPPVDWWFAGAGRPDLSVVDGLARFVLLARRAGYRVVLSEISPDLLEVLDLAGLRREVVGEAEGREDPLGVQEAVEPEDPPV